ncbi:putative membrane protein [Microbacterium proteolyticum]|jgi:putative membrane protein|uniref:Cytochrome c oxidase assembly protein n=3 Tax=Microbacterium TaxID=33882 RepID=A0A3S3P279_9MICO|nr:MULTISPECIES: cytochrome c oxidase assembly protein [Microbacterium]MBB3159481.1 putative membrane protein [Microbacterium proteolyticum]MBN9210431.1 cytochrome c oxidase assembly protein [Microbacterium sp.]MCG7418681.1 cytochrome c oxidase assembly protein [Microbacterium sp. ACRRU]MCW2166301.1 putative membrane protein [Microbacterium hydrothermale]MDI9890651.1 cytochrome c oxidase assembly protein [Microbacterium sp. IEGM 1404]
MNAPLDLGDYLLPAAHPFTLLPGAATVMATIYLLGALRLWRQHRRWSVLRTVSFVSGCAALAAVTGLAVEDYGKALLSVFMFQQLTLMMAIPPLLVLGSPGTLLLRATPHRGVGKSVLKVAHGALRWRGSRWALSPWVALPAYLAAFYGLYIADLLDPVLALPGGHTALESAFLISGILFTIPVLSTDPLPVRMSHGGRALDLFAEAALHAFFGVFLMMATSLVVGTFAESTIALGIDPIEDQRVAGGLAWSYGEAPTLIMILIVMHRWFRHDSVRDAAASRWADAHGDPELDEYNEYLRRLEKGGSA